MCTCTIVHQLVYMCICTRTCTCGGSDAFFCLSNSQTDGAVCANCKSDLTDLQNFQLEEKKTGQY